MNDQIRHDGRVESIDGEHVRVRIVQTSACASCKAASHCTSAESKEKIVDIWTNRSGQYSVGQDVVVVGATKVGMMAVAIGFVLPVILVFVAILCALQLTSSTGPWPQKEPYDQLSAAVAGILILVPYYVALYFCRAKLQTKLAFSLL